MAKSAVAMTRAKAAIPEASRAWLVSSPMWDVAWSLGEANGLKWMSLMTANVPLVAGRPRRRAGTLRPENDEGAQADEEGCRSCHAEGVP